MPASPQNPASRAPRLRDAAFREHRFERAGRWMIRVSMGVLALAILAAITRGLLGDADALRPPEAVGHAAAALFWLCLIVGPLLTFLGSRARLRELRTR